MANAISVIDTTAAAEAALEAEFVAGSAVITTNDQATAAGEDLRKLAAERKRVDEMRFAITRPLDESKAAAIAAFAPYLAKISEAEGVLRGTINNWITKERQRVARDRAEAQAKQAKIEQDLADKLAAARAKEASTPAEQARIDKQVERLEMKVELAEVTTLPVVAERKVAGISQRTTNSVESIDLLALCKAAIEDNSLLVYLQANTVQINKEVRAMGARFKVPGIVVGTKTATSVRA